MSDSRALIFVTLFALAACSADSNAPSSAQGGELAMNAPSGAKGDPAAPAPAPVEEEPETPPEIDPSPSSHPEVVYVLAGGFNISGYCTGTLVAPNAVVTAGHCLDSRRFRSWAVVAPGAEDRRVDAREAMPYDTEWSDPAHPDLGLLILESEIALTKYAELADVSARVDSAKRTWVLGVVRTEEEPEAPLRKTEAMPLTSTVELGYQHGFGVPIFSAGGDSGAGIFLIEKGEVTHKLVAVARQPEPSTSLDHLSRVDAAFIDWTRAAIGQ